VSDTDTAAPPHAPRKTAAPRTRQAKNPRGRPKAAAPETPQQRIDRLKAELQQAEEAKKLIEQQRDSIVGKIVVAHAAANADYRRQLATLLRAEVKGKADIAIIAELLN
jgi:hypothetical protein